MKNNRLAVLCLLITFTSFGFHNSFALTPIEHASTQKGQNYWRTELYFGRDKNDGTQVSEDEWESFLDEFVTPRFPAGLTVLDAKGQWKNKGKIIKESSKLLILLYPVNNRKSSNRKIEQIRNAYKKRFNQFSVIRVDSMQMVFF